jgi:hypothetical protein
MDDGNIHQVRMVPVYRQYDDAEVLPMLARNRDGVFIA